MKFPKCILGGLISTPLFSSRKFPQVQKRAKRKLNVIFKFLIANFDIKRKIN